MTPAEEKRVKAAASRIAKMIAEPGPTTFAEWAAAVMLSNISMAQFIGMPKEVFLKTIGNDWDEWADTPEKSGGVQ